MVCADFAAYVAAEREAATLFANPREWARRALFNIAGASAFSSDATIQAYADEIWKIRPQRIDSQNAREAKPV
jgi:starch phosphorylase